MSSSTKHSICQTIFETLRREILCGQFKGREKFSSEQQLMRRFHVTRTTVRLALSKLKDTGILETRNGSGTYLSAMANRVSGKLGLIVPHIVGGEYSPAICSAISQTASDCGYTVLFGDASSPSPDERVRRALALTRDYIAQDVAGVFLEPIELVKNAPDVSAEIIAEFERCRIPIVLIDRDVVTPPKRSAFDLVGIDNTQAGYRLASHLIEQGARNIVCLVRPGSAPTVALRVQGARSAVLDAGLAWTHANIFAADPDDLLSVKRLFARKHKPDAILCQNDLTALALMRNIRKLGLKVPRDVLVAGIGDVRQAALANPPLTTLRQPCRQIGQAAVATMLQRLRTPSIPPRTISLDTELVIRESTTVKHRIKQRTSRRV